MTELGNHLWQSTLFAALVAVACFALRNNAARVRYWLWLAASVKFLIPFSLLVGLGSHIVRPASTPLVPEIRAMQVVRISTSFAPLSAPKPLPPARTPWWPSLVTPVWVAGALLVTASWMRKWMQLYSIRRRASAAPVDFAIPVAVSPVALEPGVFGFFRPVLLLPDSLAQKLDPEQFETVLAHELCHVESRDNLTAALHLVVATVFWFHPAVWWIGRKLIEERERACDEAVLGQGKRPETYAQSILNICKHYQESPLACAPGVTGADLKKRIREIMSRRASYRLTVTRKSALALAAFIVVSLPLTIGMLRSQTLPPPPAYTYEVVSIKPSDPGQTRSGLRPGPQGGLQITNFTVIQMLTFAYDARAYQFVGAPGWANSEHYDVSYTPDKPEAGPGPQMSNRDMEAQFNRQRQRVQAVLRDRFGLVLKAETRELPEYVLTVARSGSKLTPAKPGERPRMSAGPSDIEASAAPLRMLTNVLANFMGRFVRDETGLTGDYTYNLKWTPDATQLTRGDASNPEDTQGASLFVAMQEQLGLKLEARKGPVPVYVVEKVVKPEAN